MNTGLTSRLVPLSHPMGQFLRQVLPGRQYHT